MKSIKSIFIFLSLVLSLETVAQIGVDNTNPHPSSVFDLAATDKGILIPRMTTVQRVAISSPATSLLVYDITESRFYFYNGAQWSALNPFVQNSGSTTATHMGDIVINGKLTATSFEGISVAGVVPKGGIIMWSGLTIPEGWALCDGNNGTPDLRERFVVGAGGNNATVVDASVNPPYGNYQLGATGGYNSIVLDKTQLAPHVHSTETFSRRGYPDGSGDRTASNPYYFIDKEKDTNLTVPSANSQLSIGSTGDGAPIENRPPFYALAFIMKL